MAVKSILFNTNEVRATLDGRKTVKRRVANKIPAEAHRIEPLGDGTFECHWGGYQPDTGAFVDGSCIVRAPYQPGDIDAEGEVIAWQPLPEPYHPEEGEKADD